MSVLYRKYRPQRFADVVGQNHVKVTIGNEIAQGNLAHAYLFVGPRGTGKTTMARLFARAINCEKRKPNSHEPCNECTSCQNIRDERSLDIMEVDAATHTQVDNVRENIIAGTRIPPANPKGYKVYIIDEIHMLSKHAFNALLKTIEEPPARVVFILATTDVFKVPGTIISRCQRFDFKKIPQKLIIDRLRELCDKEHIHISDQFLATIARRSEGCLRDAESLLGQVLSVAEKGIVTDESAEIVLPKSNWQHVETLLAHLQQRNLPASLELIHTIVEEGMDTDSFLADIIEYLRQMLLKRAIGPSYQPDFDEQTAAKITSFSQNFSPPELKRLIEIFMRETIRAKTTFIPQLPLELACIEFCQDTFIEQRTSPTSELPGPETAPTAPQSPSTSNDIVVLKSKWQNILDELRGHNHSLSVFFKVAHPLNVTASIVTIGFKFDFHANTVRESKNKRISEGIVGSILGRPITIDCIVDPNYTVNHKNFNGASEQEVQDVLSVMGGGELM